MHLSPARLRSRFRLRRRVGLLAGLGVAAGLAGSLAAEQVILTEDLALHRGTILSADGRGIAFVPSGTLGAEEAIELLPSASCVGFIDLGVGIQLAPDGGLLLLSDGQRLPGRPELRGGRLLWRHETLGSIDLDLEWVDAIVLSLSTPLPVATEKDVIVLRNGDRLEGIVESLGPEIVLAEEVGAEAGRLRIPFERVANIAFVAPPRAGSGSRIWFRDGTVLDAQRPTIASGILHVAGIALALPGGSGEDPQRRRLDVASLAVPLPLVRGVRFVDAAITPVARLEPLAIEAPPERFSAPPPTVLDFDAPLGLSRLRLAGPMSLRLALPAEARRLVAELRLPDEALPWGSVEVTIRDVEGVRYNGVLDGNRRRVLVDVEVAGRYLDVELGEAENGPIGDIVIVESGLVSSVKPPTP